MARAARFSSFRFRRRSDLLIFTVSGGSSIAAVEAGAEVVDWVAWGGVATLGAALGAVAALVFGAAVFLAVGDLAAGLAAGAASCC